MGGHWQYHYIYGDQKNEGGAVRGLRKCGYQIQHRSVGRPSVRERRGRRGIGDKREGERGGGVDKISLPARNDNEDELDVLKG